MVGGIFYANDLRGSGLMSGSIFGKPAVPSLKIFEPDSIGKKLEYVKGGLMAESPFTSFDSHHVYKLLRP